MQFSYIYPTLSPEKQPVPHGKVLFPVPCVCHVGGFLVMYYEITQYLLCLAALLQTMRALQIGAQALDSTEPSP